MSFQDIFEISQTISVQNHRTVGQQVSRSGQMRVAQYLTSVPFVFTVKAHNFLYYPQARQILNSLEISDRELVDVVIFNTNNLKWFNSYQGDLTAGQLAGFQLAAIPPANSTTFTMKGLPTVSSGTIMLKAGDFVQVGEYPYKITYDVYRGGASTVVVDVNRPIIYTTNLEINSYIPVGNNVTF
jgi:hypothetical protein